MAEANAYGKAVDSPGISSGNVAQAPVDAFSEAEVNADTEQANTDPATGSGTKRDSFTLGE